MLQIHGLVLVSKLPNGLGRALGTRPARAAPLEGQRAKHLVQGFLLDLARLARPARRPWVVVVSSGLQSTLEQIPDCLPGKAPAGTAKQSPCLSAAIICPGKLGASGQGTGAQPAYNSHVPLLSNLFYYVLCSESYLDHVPLVRTTKFILFLQSVIISLNGGSILFC